MSQILARPAHVTFIPEKPEPRRAVKPLRVVSEFEPSGDQPGGDQAVAGRYCGAGAGPGAAGRHRSGKTFTMAKVIESIQRPTLVLAPNKTLAAQLYAEMKAFFPDNAVEYFVSYYDYYQPEAYVPRSDTYIEKDSAINETIDRMRHAATQALLERSDVVIVASVSCIYGIARLRPTPKWWCGWRPAGGLTAIRWRRRWWGCSIGAMMWRLPVVHSGCGAKWWMCFPANMRTGLAGDIVWR